MSSKCLARKRNAQRMYARVYEEGNTRREFFRAQLPHGNIPSEKSAHWKRDDPLRGLDAPNAQQKMNDLASWIEGFARESL